MSTRMDSAVPTVAERRAALDAANTPWRETTLSGYLDRQAERYGDRPLVVADDRQISYAEVAEMSVILAAGLADLGVRPGDHVAIVLGNYPEWPALKFAIARLGAVAVNLNYLLRTEELRYVLRQSDSRALVVMSQWRTLDHLAALDEMAHGWETSGGGQALPELRRVVVYDTGANARSDALSFAGLLDRGRAARSAGTVPGSDLGRPDDMADIMYTSGTTGSPKGVVWTHDMQVRQAYLTARQRGLADSDRCLFALPLYHAFGYICGLLASMQVGGAIIPRLVFSPEDTCAAAERHRPTDVMLVPTMTSAILDFPGRGDYDLSSLRSVFSAGAASPQRLWQRVGDELKVHELGTGFGMTETVGPATLTEPADPLVLHSTTVGRPLDSGALSSGSDPNHSLDFRIVNPFDSADVPEGAEGELVVKGTTVTRGYYRKQDETEAAFLPGGWLRTGDLARLRPDGYVELTGRAKELYRCYGETVSPLEVENLLTSRVDIAQAFVVPLLHERLGEVGCAWIVPTIDTTVEPDEVRSWCAERLARFKVPAHVLLIDAGDLPMTTTGKIRKHVLADRAAASLTAPDGGPTDGR